MSGNSEGNIIQLQEEFEKDIQQEAAEMYQLIFKISRYFITQSRNCSIDELLTHNDPTYEEIAKETTSLAKFMESLADLGGWDEERMTLNVKQAAIYMSQMAMAIVNNNEDELKIARNHLESITFI
jgi:hypothetical protein